jgi:hypothetical protein
MKTQKYFKSGLVCFILTFLIYCLISFAGRLVFFGVVHIQWTQALKFAVLFTLVLTIMDYLKESGKI